MSCPIIIEKMKYKPFFCFNKSKESSKLQKVFYVYVNGKQAGPMSESELKVLVKNGSVSSDTLVWTPQLEQWTQAQYVPPVNKLLLLTQKTEITHLSAMPQREINPIRADLVNAIIGLGFKKNEAIAAIDKVIDSQSSVSLENAIKEVLKLLR